ncbi:hypothetical protein AVEN_6676-1 [Araneus ventricosus]|uniref:Uncharacterized protein n=1 Tax=Araneus ventricosus TaxID=182803 RepID=A0A4Y2X7B0_ARAVE|nr:hypothetical protein AVEN_6676-1 [Araneus ventricosus]
MHRGRGALQVPSAKQVMKLVPWRAKLSPLQLKITDSPSSNIRGSEASLPTGFSLLPSLGIPGSPQIALCLSTSRKYCILFGFRKTRYTKTND